VHAALDAGYTFFDLADIYGGGECERIFGEALRERPGVRDGLVIASKCGIRLPDVPVGAPHRYDFSREYIGWSVEQSLRRLGVEALDVLILHRPDYLMDPEEVAGVFGRLRASGKVREFGVSNFTRSQVVLLQRAWGSPLVTHQLEVSLRSLEALENGLLDQCLMEGMTPTAWSPLGRGVLGMEGWDGMGVEEVERMERVRGVLDELAEREGVGRTEIALAWLLRHPTRMIPVVGSVRPERIVAMTRALDVSMGREDWYRLLVAGRGERLP
jgi:predicted oxidoreductase